MRMKVLITGSRQASSAMLAKVEEVVLWVKRQGYALLGGGCPRRRYPFPGMCRGVVGAHHGLRRVRPAAGSAS